MDWGSAEKILNNTAAIASLVGALFSIVAAFAAWFQKSKAEKALNNLALHRATETLKRAQEECRKLVHMNANFRGNKVTNAAHEMQRYLDNTFHDISRNKGNRDFADIVDEVQELLKSLKLAGKISDQQKYAHELHSSLQKAISLGQSLVKLR